MCFMLDFESGLTLIQPLLLQAILIYESKQKLYGSVKHLRLIMLHLVTSIWARDRENNINQLLRMNNNHEITYEKI